MTAETKPGLGVDEKGIPIGDPTQNVRELFEAGMTRQDDLREAAQELVDSKIAGLDGRLDAAEKLRIEQKNDSQQSIDSAFRAASELVRLQADGQATSINSIQIALNDVRDRLGRMEAVKQGQQDTREDSRSNVGMNVGILGAVFGFLMLAAVIIIAVIRGSGA